ncbi:MAG: hypothetical protein JWO36_3321 [Myxococcales bacterium]|nr:hypothetical protein [Myxococcales bacterium]
MKMIDVSVSRLIPASPEAVFDVWLDAKNPGGPWFGTERVILDPKVDGLFYHSVAHEGRSWAHYGRFTVIERPRRIEHTWVSEATRGHESVVAVTLEPRDGKTEVKLRHTGVPDDEMGRGHEAGWKWMLEALEQQFAKR